jgi:hypothetical protein
MAYILATKISLTMIVLYMILFQAMTKQKRILSKENLKNCLNLNW